MAARAGWTRVSTPTEMSTTPTTGMSFHANGSGIPKIAKYGSHAALVMTPKAPWPMKHAATATRRIQCSIPMAGGAVSSSSRPGDRSSNDLPWRVAVRSIMALPSEVSEHPVPSAPAEEARAPTGDSRSQAARRRTALASLPDGLEVERRRPLSDLPPQDEPVLTGTAEMDAGIDPGVGALPRRLRETRERSRDPFEGLATRYREVGLVAAQDAGKGHRRRPAEGALRGRIVRDVRGVLVTVPGRVADGRVVDVVVTLANSGHGAP